MIRDHLILFINGVQQAQDGSTSERRMITSIESPTVSLTFGYGYFGRDKVLVHTFEYSNGVKETIDQKQCEVEDAVDLYLKSIHLAEC